MGINIIKYYSTNNECYSKNVNRVDSRYSTFQRRGAQGLMLHSVGCSQSSAKVFANNWNKAGAGVAVHAVLQADGTVYQCLPWNYRGWHAGGDANNTHIGIEMTEPDCITYVSGSKFTVSAANKSKAQAQVKGTYEAAVFLFAQLCEQLNLNPLTDIISHKEGYAKGIASNHGDPEHLWTQLGMGYTMDGFRKAVKTVMDGSAAYLEQQEAAKQETAAAKEIYRVRTAWNNAKSQIGAYTVLENAKKACKSGYKVYNGKGIVVYDPAANSAPAATSGFTAYKVRVKISNLYIRKGAGTNYNTNSFIKPGVYTIVAQSSGKGSTKGWGKLKSGAGWISLDYAYKL